MPTINAPGSRQVQTFSQISAKTKNLGDNETVRFSREKQVYAHKNNITGLFAGKARLQKRATRQRDGVTAVKNALTMEFGPQFADKAFQRIGIKNKITGMDMKMLRREVGLLTKKVDSSFASENTQFLGALAQTKSIIPDGPEGKEELRAKLSQLINRYIDPDTTAIDEKTGKSQVTVNVPHKTKVDLLEARDALDDPNVKLSAQYLLDIRDKRLGQAAKAAGDLVHESAFSGMNKYYKEDNAHVEVADEILDNLNQM